MADAKVTISLVDLTQDRLKTLRRDFEELAKLRGKTASSPAEREQADQLRRQARELRDVERGARGAQSSVSALQRTMSGASSAVGGVGGAALGGFVGGAGLGPIGGLMTALATGSITGAVAAVAAIIGQATKMAYQFEQSSTRTAQVLGIGTGGSLAGNTALLQKAAYAGGKYNISAPEMMQAITTYGKASGSTAAQAAAAGGTIGLYSRAYGLDPTQLAAQMGGIVAMSGRDVKGEAAGVFGAAETAGPLGRRLDEFIGLATSTLGSMQAANPLGKYSGADSSAWVAGISQAGGYFNTSAGVNAAVGASQSLMAPVGKSMYRLAMLTSAGIKDPAAMMLGINTPEDDMKILAHVSKISGKGGITSTLGISNLLNAEGGNTDAAKTLYSLVTKLGGHDQASDMRAIRVAYGKGGEGRGGGKGPLTPEEEAKKAAANLQAYYKSLLGGDEKLFADIQNKELQIGQKVLGQLSKSAAALDEILNGNITGGIMDLIKSNEALIAALAVATLGPTALKAAMGFLGPLGRLFMGGGAAAAGDAAGIGLGAPIAAGAAVALFGMAPAGSDYGGDETKDYMGQTRQYWLDYANKRGGIKNYFSKLPHDVQASFNQDVLVGNILGGLSGAESGYGKNQGSGAADTALGIYQVEPWLHVKEMKAAFQAAGTDTRGFFTLGDKDVTDKGRAAYLKNPAVQRGTASDIVKDLYSFAKTKGLDANSEADVIASYYGGQAHWGEMDYVPTGNTLTQGQYVAEVLANIKEGLKANSGKPTVSHKTTGDLDGLDIHHHTVIKKKAPKTGSALPGSRKAGYHG